MERKHILSSNNNTFISCERFFKISGKVDIEIRKNKNSVEVFITRTDDGGTYQETIIIPQEV